MATSPTDILTTLKNAVTAIATATQTYQTVQGSIAATALSSATLIPNNPKRLCMVSITTAGSTNGVIYDSTSTSSLTNPIYTIPNTIGIVSVNLPVSYGIVVSPGTGQVVTVSYS